MVVMEQLIAMTTVTKIMIMQMVNNKMDNRMIMMTYVGQGYQIPMDYNLGPEE